MSSKKNKINSYKRLLSYLWPYKKLLILSVVFMLFVALSNLVVPWIIKDVIDQVLEQKDLRMLYFGHCSYFSDFLYQGAHDFRASISDGVYRTGGYYGYP